jgi:hypothetical protein
MKYVLMALAILLGSGVAAEARQRHRGHHHGYAHHYGRYLVVRHWRHLARRHSRHLKHFAHKKNRVTGSGVRVDLPWVCRHRAAPMGGPCGCWTGHSLLGTTAHVWHGINLWLAADWLRFPRSSPGPGTAAVWRNHSHVAPVARDNHDGTVSVSDYWGVHRVRLAEIIIVNPTPRRPPARQGASPL